MADIKLDEDSVFGRQFSVKTLEEILDVPRIRENARGRIAAWIVTSLLAIVFLSYFTFIIMSFEGKSPPTFSDLKDLTDQLIAPIVGIVGAVTGFYFGEKNSDKKNGSHE